MLSVQDSFPTLSTTIFVKKEESEDTDTEVF